MWILVSVFLRWTEKGVVRFVIALDDDIAEYAQRITNGGVMAERNDEKGQVEDMPSDEADTVVRGSELVLIRYRRHS